ncbi:PREDICTED: putative selection and upkeep of intraepithelial T-cells protein 1 homolog [Elephantulus edwardii]|uniref:putative selection and upkeep of intraepithelial T-cells protein 1 homolog n=1 Tax=Elephantulus edwardii TaxID=28737 RepID=UPI0003F0E10C|nr:PREDICTED: putative selection and upkeep of intraepithelial T-cells protein 1 homolog [Elephantulus edwardii]
MNHTEFLKDTLEEGKMTLRIHNISSTDDGQYHCFLKDANTYEEAVMDLKVAGLGLEIQIFVELHEPEGIVVECNSGGWFPQPQMEWKGNKGHVIPHSTKFYTQDRDGLFHIKITLLLKNTTQNHITCCIYNPVTDQEKKANIFLSDDETVALKVDCTVMKHIYYIIDKNQTPGHKLQSTTGSMGWRCHQTCEVHQMM